MQLKSETKSTFHGKYSKSSPVVGARVKELELIYTHKEIFANYQKVVYDQQKLNVIPLAFKEKADEISKEIYAAYIKKYSDHGLTIENSVDWNNVGFTRTYLSDLENEWNTWFVDPLVATPNDKSHIEGQMYRPAYICALHELMHVEEMTPGISKGQYARFESVVEVLTVTKTIILMDEVYKKTLNLPMDIEVDYENSFKLFGKTIKQGEFANFYRTLEAKYPSLAEALVSKQSLTFLNQTNVEPMNINMQVLGGFLAVVGYAAVALALLLNNASFGTLGLVVTGLGVASIFGGVGLFANGIYKNERTTDNEILDASACLAGNTNSP
ncbi:TPA: hypothetical protein I8Y89_003053 [Legionella pneumophila]|uniref:hypothetical protein n=1 Tax=Legionella pneumophila TaxID=446 RepID=UPI0004866AEB|nr:hypothetical protein [Legionella pneumophila]MDW8900007.1 hypothetical protein [Legionella pneumophila]MDW8905353.1 hypothetical protein [Legionella pneumophila]MDW9175537.1 hypothetical protein [Legionella pneumophila]TIG87503.1 hypothetical protein DI110_00055 [Legionella pneumophila]CZG25507.1 Uncharacterised protein [Legionella pneumophila]